jgi:hypothetical protein
MAAFDFPASPTLNQVYTPAGGPSYYWDGAAWRIALSGNPGALVSAARNMIVNPSMQVSQEVGSAVQTVSGTYPADQWMGAVIGSAIGKISFNSGTSQGVQMVNFNTVAAVTPAGADVVMLASYLEGYETAQLEWGNASAKRAILRFRARLSGPAGSPVNISASIRNYNESASFTKLFTVPSGNVWTDFSAVIPANTAASWQTTNSVGLSVGFTTCSGPTYTAPADGIWNNGNFVASPGQGNVHAQAGRSIQLTDVGLYVDQGGTGVLPEFVRPSFSDELRRCKRYWEMRSMIVIENGTLAQGYWEAEKRIVPALTCIPSVGSGGQWIATGTTGWYQSVANSAITQGNIIGNARF